MEVAMNLAYEINEPACIALIGELGAGKTVFVKGIAKALGITEVIKSPSFVIMRSYEGRMKLYHLDFYRIVAINEIFPFEEYFLRDGITAVEWADKTKNILPEERIEVRIDIQKKEKRRVTINDYRN